MKILDSEFEESDNMLSENSQIDDDEINGEVQAQSPVKKIRSVAKKLKNSEHLRKDFEKFCNKQLNLKRLCQNLMS
nr:unnamed protein product [Callosobruchus analis]